MRKLRIWPGNDLSKEAVYNCKDCGAGNLCDACHIHDEPRGHCTECPQPVNDKEENL